MDAVKAHLRRSSSASGSMTCRRTRSAHGSRPRRWSTTWSASTSSEWTRRRDKVDNERQREAHGSSASLGPTCLSSTEEGSVHMVGRTALAAVAASALVFAGGGLAYADNDFPDADSSLIEVYVQSESDIEKLVTEGFDLAEYKRVEDDQIVVAVDATPIEVGALKQRGFGIGRTIENPKHRAAIAAERDAQRELDSRAARVRRPAACPRPGPPSPSRARPSSSAPTSSPTTPARSCTSRRTTRRPCAPRRQQRRSPARRCDGVRRRRRRLHGGRRPTCRRFIDTDPTPDEYLYHRQLIRLTAAAGRHPGLPDDGPRGRQLRLRRHLQGHGVGRQDAAAERRGLPEGLLQPLPGPDREPRPARRAGRRVPEPGHARSTSRT